MDYLLNVHELRLIAQMGVKILHRFSLMLVRIEHLTYVQVMIMVTSNGLLWVLFDQLLKYRGYI